MFKDFFKFKKQDHSITPQEQVKLWAKELFKEASTSNNNNQGMDSCINNEDKNGNSLESNSNNKEN